MIRHYQPRCISESAAPFSQVVIDDRYAHLAGLVAADFPDGVAVLGDPGKETTAVLAVIRSILEELDMTTGDIVRTDVHLASLDDFDAMDGAYRKFFTSGQYPARTTTQSSRLFGGSLVEITCMAQLPG